MAFLDVAKPWLQEKHCVLCLRPIGYGKFRLKKFHCQTCQHAVCHECSDPHLSPQAREKRTHCRRCLKIPAILPSKLELAFDTVSDINRVTSPSEDTTMNEALHMMKCLFDEHTKALHDNVATYSQHLLKLHSEACALKTQEEWYCQQLKRQDGEIEGIAGRIDELYKVNEELRRNVKMMEQKITKIDRNAIQRELESCWDEECCTCMIA